MCPLRHPGQLNENTRHAEQRTTESLTGMTDPTTLVPPPAPPTPPTPGSTPALAARLAEAARYALLRRLAPTLRHDMAGALQPISMVAVMLEKRLQKPAPDMGVIGKNVHDINTLAREASSTCMQLMTWLAPKQDALVGVHEGLQDVTALVATELSFQGVTLVNDTEGSPSQLPTSVLRGLFMTSLLALTDSHVGPATVRLGAAQQGADTVLTLTLEPSASQGDYLPAHASYRLLDWDDVRALAAAESVEFTLDYDADTGSTQVTLRCPGAAVLIPPAA